MIGILTNRPEYRNDIAEEIRLFSGLSDIALLSGGETAETVFDLRLNRLDEGGYRLIAKAGGVSYEAAFSIPGTDRLTIKKHEKRQIKLAAYALLKKLYPDVETPWGSLTGIRPTKLFRELTHEAGEAEAEKLFTGLFGVSSEKTALAAEICRVQRPFLKDVSEKDLDVYIGIPFCRTRCLYCSFVSEVLKDPALLTAYLAGLKEDIRNGGEILRAGGYRLRAMYVGGGTPTVLSAAQLADLLETAFAAYGGYGRELTVEAGRPDTIDREKLLTLERMGVGRISINPQTMNDGTLKTVGRAHSVADVIAAYDMAREIGFDSINMDVIAGLPGEDAADMDRTYREVARLQPDNLTVHALAVKRSSLLKKQLERYPLPSGEVAEEMIRGGYACAKAMGMTPYYLYRQKYMSGNLENVGYALPDRVCAYNIDMMEETACILSHGAGSMTKRVFSGERRIERLPSPKDVPTYLAKLPLLAEEKRRFFLD